LCPRTPSNCRAGQVFTADFAPVFSSMNTGAGDKFSEVNTTTF
jgi:hypothetical protein